MLIEADTFYNVLIGRHTLNKLDIVITTYYMAMKFLVSDNTIITIKVNSRGKRMICP